MVCVQTSAIEWWLANKKTIFSVSASSLLTVWFCTYTFEISVFCASKSKEFAHVYASEKNRNEVLFCYSNKENIATYFIKQKYFEQNFRRTKNFVRTEIVFFRIRFFIFFYSKWIDERGRRWPLVTVLYVRLENLLPDFGNFIYWSIKENNCLFICNVGSSFWLFMIKMCIDNYDVWSKNTM